jgi:hypothetical protein
MVRRPEFDGNGASAWMGVLGRERVWKRCAQGLDHCFYRAREGEGAATGANWPLMAMEASPALKAFKGARDEE